MSTGEKMITSINNPSSSLSLSSDQIDGLALVPNSTELEKVTDLIQSNLESSEGSEIGSNLLVGCADGLVALVREGFRLLRFDKALQGLVSALSNDHNMWRAFWANMCGAATGNITVQNYIRTGEIRGNQQPLTAEEKRSWSARTKAVIWQILRVLSGKWIWDMIKDYMDELLVGKMAPLMLIISIRNREERDFSYHY